MALSTKDACFTNTKVWHEAVAWPPNWRPPLFADLNSDGKLDIVSTYEVANDTWRARVWLSVGPDPANGNQFVYAYKGEQVLAPTPVWTTANGLRFTSALVDVNGDGCGDLVTVSSPVDAGTAGNTSLTVRVALANGDGTFKEAGEQPLAGDFSSCAGTAPPTVTPLAQCFFQPAYADANGDGKTDVVLLYQQDITRPSIPTGTYAQVALSNGNGSFSDMGMKTLSAADVAETGAAPGTNGWFATVADVNGDAGRS